MQCLESGVGVKDQQLGNKENKQCILRVIFRYQINDSLDKRNLKFLLVLVPFIIQ